MYGLFGSFLLFLFVSGLVGLYHISVWGFGFEFVERSWVSSFECGFVAQRLAENYFSYVYFILLVFFVVFDLEISLLLNMPCQGELFKNMAYYVFFLGLVGIGFGYEVYSGYVGWGY